MFPTRRVGSAIVPNKGWVIFGIEDENAESSTENSSDEEKVEDPKIQILDHPDGKWITGPRSYASQGECVVQVSDLVDKFYSELHRIRFGQHHMFNQNLQFEKIEIE